MNTIKRNHALVVSRAGVCLTLCALLVACGDANDPVGVGMDGGDTSAGMDGDGDGDAGAEAGASGEGDGTADDGGTGEQPPGMGVCGDGLVQAAEECDDGINDGSYDGCNADCTHAAFCGDGTLNGASETCDDGDADSADGCLADCSVPASCEDIKILEPDAADGNYIIDPDGPLGAEPELVYCDMTTLVVEWSEPFEIPGSFGGHTGGGGVAIGEIGAGAGPDMVIFHIEDQMSPTQGYYRIAWNLDETGEPTLGWTDVRAVPTIEGTTDAEGGGIALADINGNGVLDLVMLHVDDPSGPNQAYYRVGFDLDQDGNVAGGWTELFEITGNLASDTDGAGIAVLDLNGNGAPELVVLHVEDPGGEVDGLSQIGWDIDTNGEVAIWAPSALLPGAFGGSNQSAGLEIIPTTSGPSLLVSNVDDPWGENEGFYRVGRQIDAAGGVAGGWSESKPIPGWWGDNTGFGGVAAVDLGGDGSLDMVHFHIDERSGSNLGYFRWGYGS